MFEDFPSLYRMRLHFRRCRCRASEVGVVTVTRRDSLTANEVRFQSPPTFTSIIDSGFRLVDPFVD